MTTSKSSSQEMSISVGLFLISAAVAWRRQRRQRHWSDKIVRSTKAADSVVSRELPHEPTGSVSTRGQAALSPPIPYLNQFLACLANFCDPEHNPQGHIPLCVAENKLVLDLIAERVMQSAAAAFADRSVFCYSSFQGMPLPRQAIAHFLTRRFLYPDISQQQIHHQRVNHEHIIIGSGGSSLIHQTFLLLGEAGDACLIPAPYYAAFENDMNLIAKVVPVPVVQDDPIRGPSEIELEGAKEVALSKGCNPRFILLTNPHNPLGTIYKPEAIKRIVKWARSNDMHVVVDEIYALSTLHENHNFQSVIKVLDNQLGTDVHFVWAMSKDFGSSGLRFGVLYSQNEIFLEAMATSNMFSGVSGPIQYVCAELLTDEPFVDRFLEQSRLRTLQAYELCTSKLEEMVVPYIPAEAGMFVYADFSNLLPEKTFEWEAKLGQLIFEYARIVLTPGQSQRDHRPGMFRICYAWVHPEILDIAMERLSRLVAKVRRMDWTDLGDRALSNVLEL